MVSWWPARRARLRTRWRSLAWAESALAVSWSAAESGDGGRGAGDSRIQGRGMRSSMQEVVKSMAIPCIAESGEEPIRKARVAWLSGTRSRREADPWGRR
jgi:hypothetical protein